MGRVICICLAWALAGVAPSWAKAPESPLPTPQFRHYEVADGLPSSNVTLIRQDARGLIWMTSGNGLVRYNGEHFRVYRHAPGHPDSLRGNVLSALAIDHDQRIWVGGDNTGLNVLDPATGHIRSWVHAKHDPHSLGGNDVDSLAVAPDGSLWVSVMGYGLDHMTGPGRFRHFIHRKGDPDSLSSNILFVIKALPDGSILAGGTGGLDHLGSDGHVRHVRFQGLADVPLVWGIDGKPGDIRIATTKGLYRLESGGVARRMYPGILPASLTVTSLRAPDGSLWVGGGNGLYWIGADGRSRHFEPRLQGPRGVPGTVIWNIFRDREGGLWFGTFDGGVAYLRPSWKRFVVYHHQLGNPGTLSINRVISLMADGSSLLVGGADGALDRIDPGTGRVRNQLLKAADGNSVMGLAPAGPDSLWITLSDGVALKTGDTIRKVRSPIIQHGANIIVSDARGNAYVYQSTARAVRIDRRTLQAHALTFKHGNVHERDIHALAMHQGRVWAASSGGVLRADPSGRVWSRVPGIPAVRVRELAFDAHGVWLIQDARMAHYRLQDGHATRDRLVGVAQGWPETQVQSAFVDDRQRVWLGTNNGLWRYDPATGAFRSFGVQDGMASQEFTTRSAARMPDGTWYLGTMHGVVGWNPSRLSARPRPPHLAWAGITVQRGGATHDLADDGRPIDLRWNDHELRVRVNALSYIDPAHNQYRFRLDGLDAGWVDTGNRGQRDFTSLSHGDYLLHVAAAGPGGAWTELKPLRIHVARPPWATWWAWMAYVCIALALVAAVTLLARRRIEQRHRVQMAERERAMAEQASAAKSSFLATLGHEIRTPMTGVLGMAELLLRSPLEPRQREYAQAIQRSGTLLLRLVNEALDMARIEAGRLQLEVAAFDPRELVRDVVKLESGVAEDKGLRLDLRVGDAVPAAVRGDALRIKQILLNLLNNALKFTERGQVELAVDWVESGLVFRVSDTGPGIAEDSRERLFQRYEQADGPRRSSGTGLGLAICRELSTLMGGRCELEASDADGSTFRVWLPLPVVDVHERAPTAREAGDAAWNLLLVEDDATVAGVIQGLLETRGHRVTHAAQGLAALSESENQAFDAVLLDLDLPGLDGFAVARMLRERGLRQPIIAITARSGGEEEARSRAAGMDAFLRKPLGGGELEATLRQMLARD